MDRTEGLLHVQSFSFAGRLWTIDRSRGLGGLDHTGNRPDEPDHLPRDGDGDHIGGLAQGGQPPIAGTQPNLSLPGDLDLPPIQWTPG